MATPTQQIEEKVKEFENRFGGFIATQSKREKQDKDNNWLRQALHEMYEIGRTEGDEVFEILKNSVLEGSIYKMGAADMKKRILEALPKEREVRLSRNCADCSTIPMAFCRHDMGMNDRLEEIRTLINSQQ